jgi:hypothetical protein
MQFIYPKSSIKDVQATGKAFSLKREHPARQHEILQLFQFLWIIFAPPASVTRIRIPNMDPDPEH